MKPSDNNLNAYLVIHTVSAVKLPSPAGRPFSHSSHLFSLPLRLLITVLQHGGQQRPPGQPLPTHHGSNSLTTLVATALWSALKVQNKSLQIRLSFT